MKNLEEMENKIRFITMGMKIDHSKGLNHRIRTIIKTSDNKYLFIEILQGTRPDRCYTNKTQKEYLKTYPNEHYIVLDSCFRVDIPEDYYKNYSKDFAQYQKGYYELDYTKENIIKLLQQFNKNITDYELIKDYDYIKNIIEQNKFYKLYDLRLTHTYEPLKIMWQDAGQTKFKGLYTCWNYNKTIQYTEYMENIVYNNQFDRLKELYGIDTINILQEEYNERMNIFKRKEV